MDDRFAYQARVFEGYEQAAPNLIPAYKALSPEAVLAPVAEYLPSGSARVMDVGAGPGTLAASLASRGYHVTAIEPVSRFRVYGQSIYGHLDIDWHNACLPHLNTLPEHPAAFDAILAIGVLHHLQPKDQEGAISTLPDYLSPSGRLILSLRHGPCPPDRPGFPVDPDALVNTALTTGLRVLHRSSNISIQPGNQRAGVTWTWLVFEAD